MEDAGEGCAMEWTTAPEALLDAIDAVWEEACRCPEKDFFMNKLGLEARLLFAGGKKCRCDSINKDDFSKRGR